jgi:hexosaminidase
MTIIDIDAATISHAGTAPLTIPVIPVARTTSVRSGSFRLASGDAIVADTVAADVVERFIVDLQIDAGVGLELVPRADAGTPAISVELGFIAPDGVPLATGVRADGRTLAEADERYEVTIAAAGIQVHAATPEGVHRALTTLRQLVAAAVVGDVAELPELTLVDGPRFAWRGLSLDVVRTFHGPETVRRVIDMCSLYKLNVLHLHLTDDQGWRFEVPEWPLLAEVGGAGAVGDRPGGYFTQDDVADLVGYAAERFVTIVPEVDLPGHAQAIFRAYPELAPKPTPESEAAAAAGFAIGTLDLGRGPTRRFLEDVIAAAAEQFGTSAWIHVGGDEAFGMAREDHAAFVDAAMDVVRRHGRRPLGWQEAGRSAVGPGDVIQYWIEPNETLLMLQSGMLQTMLPPEVAPVLEATLRESLTDVPEAVAKGARVLVSPTTRLYFDRPHAGPAIDDAQEAQRERVGMPFYPPTSLRDMVEWDPVQETPGAVSDDQLIGLEAALWCETVTNQDDLEFLLLPRLAGAGERAWSASPTEWADYSRRLSCAPRAWNRRGWVWFRSTEADWLD